MSTTAPKLPHINNVLPFSADDQACFDEIRAVLRRHGKASRFGLTLLHNHFELGEDEVMIETCDSANRNLTIRPAPVSLAQRHLATNWRLDVPSASQHCEQYCQLTEDRDTGEREHQDLHRP